MNRMPTLALFVHCATLVWLIEIDNLNAMAGASAHMLDSLRADIARLEKRVRADIARLEKRGHA